MFDCQNIYSADGLKKLCIIQKDDIIDFHFLHKVLRAYQTLGVYRIVKDDHTKIRKVEAVDYICLIQEPAQSTRKAYSMKIIEENIERITCQSYKPHIFTPLSERSEVGYKMMIETPGIPASKMASIFMLIRDNPENEPELIRKRFSVGEESGYMPFPDGRRPPLIVVENDISRLICKVGCYINPEISSFLEWRPINSSLSQRAQTSFHRDNMTFGRWNFG